MCEMKQILNAIVDECDKSRDFVVSGIGPTVKIDIDLGEKLDIFYEIDAHSFGRIKNQLQSIKLKKQAEARKAVV